MTAKNPRITITLEPSTAAQLRRMSELTGNSQSSMISELLTEAAPVFDRMIALLEAAEVAMTAAREDTASRLKLAQLKIEEQMGLMFDWMDDSSRPILEHAEKIKRRARKSGDGVVSTPLSNRGVRSPHESTENKDKSTAYKNLLQKKEHAQKTAQKCTEKGAV